MITNCKNCGAPIISGKCSYCGTCYDDYEVPLQKALIDYKSSDSLWQAQENLNKAQQSRLRVLKNGQFVFVKDTTAIRHYQNIVDELRQQEIISKLDEQIYALELEQHVNNRKQLICQ